MESSFKLSVSTFMRPDQDIPKLIRAMMNDLGEKTPDFSSIQEALDWLNMSTAPFKLFLNFMFEDSLGEPGRDCLKKIHTKYGKSLIEFTFEELKNFSLTPEGEELKRVILVRKYPIRFSPIDTESREEYIFEKAKLVYKLIGEIHSVIKAGHNPRNLLASMEDFLSEPEYRYFFESDY